MLPAVMGGGGQTGYDVKVLAWRGEADAVVAAIRSVLPVDVSTARQLFDRAPLVVKRAISRDAASAYVALLEGIGAQVEVLRSGAYESVQDRGATLLMAVDVREFVGETPAEPGGEPSDNLRVEPFWDPRDRAMVERARRAADPTAVHDLGLDAASLPPMPAARAAPTCAAPSSAIAGLPALPELSDDGEPEGSADDDSIPPALLGDDETDYDDSIPPALLGDDETDYDDDEDGAGYGLLSSDPPRARAIGSAAAPALELGVDLASIRPQGYSDAGAVVPSSPPLARALDSGAAAARRVVGAALERLYLWAYDNSDEPALCEDAPSLHRAVARMRREFAVFVVWALELGDSLSSSSAGARVRTRAAAEPAQRSKSPHDAFPRDHFPSPRPTPAKGQAAKQRRRLDLPPVPLLALGLSIFAGGVQFDSSILLGTAGAVSLVLHGLAIFVLGLAAAALAPRRTD